MSTNEPFGMAMYEPRNGYNTADEFVARVDRVVAAAQDASERYPINPVPEYAPQDGPGRGGVTVTSYPTYTVRHRPAANPARATHRHISGPDGFAAYLTPFQGSNLKGVEGAYWGTGRLRDASEEYYDAYYDARAADNIAYTVVSYSTPIAWVLRDGTVVQPPVKYSVTTSRHMSLLAWLGTKGPNYRADETDQA